jgi:hypothetical protein
MFSLDLMEVDFHVALGRDANGARCDCCCWVGKHREAGQETIGDRWSAVARDLRIE